MSDSNAGMQHIFCPACDKLGNPARMLKIGSGRSEGMVVRCTNQLHTYNYPTLMKMSPRMDKPDFVEKQPAGTVSMTFWVYPEAMESLRQKFPTNLQTTMCAGLTALADPDAVLITGEDAREFAALGIKRGREILGLAREVIELRKKCERMEIQMEPFLRLLGAANPIPESPTGQQQPPRAQFANLVESESGLLMPADGRETAGEFSFAGPRPNASQTPGFVNQNLR